MMIGEKKIAEAKLKKQRQRQRQRQLKKQLKKQRQRQRLWRQASLLPWAAAATT